MKRGEERLTFETIYHGMYEGIVFSGWVDRHLKQEWSQRYVFPRGGGMGPRIFITPAHSRKEILLEAFPVIYQKPHPLPDALGGYYLAYRGEEVERFCEEPGLSLAVRIQGHLYILRQRNRIPPSHMERLIGNTGDYRVLFENTLQVFSLPLLHTYLRVLLSLGGEEDWLWAEKTLLPPMKGSVMLSYHRYFLEQALEEHRRKAKRDRYSLFRGRLKGEFYSFFPEEP